ncbi:manganese transporter [Heyndrickxia sporothermodurans]|nr:manganese transporter [Heyndrickxia sporothermodurans]
MESHAEKNVGSETSTQKVSFLKKIGPAFITSALIIGPGSVTLSSKIGAVYGNQLIWVVIVMILFMMIFTEMSARIGLASQFSFLEILKRKWGKSAAIIIGIGSCLVTASFQAGNAIGAGIAASAILGLSSTFWIVITTILSIGLLFAKSFYKILEKLMLGLVVIMLVSFGLTVIISKPSVSDIVLHLVPSIPSGSMPLVIALTATSFSIVGAVYQSYLVQEKGWGISQARSGIRDSYLGIFILGLITVMIMITSAAVLLPKGIQVNSAAEMGQALEPLYGNWAMIVFMLGLFGASLSSLVGNATIGGAMLSDGFGLGRKLESKAVRGLICLVMIFGSAVGIIFGGSPINLIIFAQAITIIIVPFIAIAILFVANDQSIMGKLKNTFWKNVIGIAGLIVLILLAINNVINIFFK